LALQGHRQKQSLILDSGCSGHMTGNKSLLTSYEEKPGPTISFGDGNKGKTVGYGKLCLGNVIIEDVALVEGLKHNLVSMSQLSDKGYQSTFDKSGCRITHQQSGKVVLEGKRIGNIYEASLENLAEGTTTCLYS